jgi:2'-hydroxyisoflavone reductase
MRILLIGGTAFAGRHITLAALAAGHDVTLFHRGKTGADLFPQATHLLGDRNQDLSALGSGQWDATIDLCAFFPRQVRSLAGALGGRGGRYTFISSTSAYRTPVAAGFTEDAPLAEIDDPDAETTITEQNYGGLKVACERAAAHLHADAGVTIVRPTYIVGPYDYSYRLTWWVERIARGGEVLAPGPQQDPIQVIDARDMGAWIVSMAERSVTGAFHAVSPPPPFGFGDLLEAIAAEVAPPGTTLTWLDSEFLIGQGEGEDLPLWPGADSERDINAADPSAALAAGLAPRPLRQSIAEIHADQLAAPTPSDGIGITPEREAELLALWHAR